MSLFLVLAACGPMESPLSIVDDLRVVDLHVEPACPAPGEVPRVDLAVLDGAGTGFDTWSWWCVDGVCGEGPVPEGSFAVVRGLACAPDVCDGPGPDLADPAAWLVDLPFEGVALSERRVPISPPGFPLNGNPVFVQAPVWPDEVAVGEVALVEVVVEDAADQILVGAVYATAGSIPEATVELVDGRAELTWTAPEQPGSVDLVVVVDDGLGGSVHRRHTVQVR